LDVDELIAHLLVTEGFSEIEEVAFVPVEDLTAIEGFDADIVEEMRTRARTYLSEQEEKLTARRRELGVAAELAEIPGLTSAALVSLGENGVKTLDDLADLASDELLELLPEGAITAEDADRAIMAARAHWFEDEEAEETAAAGETGEEPAAAAPEDAGAPAEADAGEETKSDDR
ncbi:MAG: helix-hairpin-helix domain-containing protein, partial [Alphaproteobacteria bacterium]